MRVNVSAIKCFQRSEAEWYYRYLSRRVPLRPEGAYFSTGIWWHEVMETMFVDKESAIEDAPLRAQEMYDELCRRPESATVAAKFLDETKRLTLLLPLLPERFLISDTISVEESIETELGGTGRHTLIGRPDRVVRHNGKIWHRQYRTISDRTPMDIYIQTRERDLHELIYAWLIVGKHHIPSEEYGGTIMDITRKISYKAIREHPNTAFVQELIPIDWNQVIDAVLDCQDIVRRMQDIADGARPIHNREADTNRFGNILSPYYDVYTERVSINDDTLFMKLDDPYASEVAENTE